MHEIPPEVRMKAVSRVFNALRHGGQLMVLDFQFPNTIEDLRNPAFDFAIHDQFFEICAGIVHPTSDERDEMLKGAGFGNLQKTAIGKGMFELVVADKL